MKYNLENKMVYKVLLYIIFAILVIIMFAKKQDVIMDELYNYGLANHIYMGAGASRMEPIEGVAYVPAENAYLEYVAVQEDNRFDYKNVWKNQAHDVHPPLYYSILHTICSFFPNTYSMWYAGSINIVFALLAFWAVRKLAGELGGNGGMKSVISVCFMTTAGLINIYLYLRMYVMAMFWVTLLTYLFVKGIKRGFTKSWFLTLFVVSVCGALTHYYVIIWLFFLSLVMTLWLLCSKQWKALLGFCGAMFIAGGVTLTIFPSMLTHVFSIKTDHPKFVERLNFGVVQYLKRIHLFYGYLNQNVFGGTLTYILIMVLVAVLLLVREYCVLHKGNMKKAILELKKNRKCMEQMVCWLFLIIPCLCFWVLVSRIANYEESRYMHPIYAVCLVLGVYCIWGITKVFARETYHRLLFGMIMFAIIVNGWRVCTWGFRYSSGEEIIEIAKQYSDKECIFVYVKNKGQYLQSSYYEIRNYKEVTFITDENLEILNNLSVGKQSDLVVYIASNCDEEAVLEEILNKCPLMEEYEQISHYGNARAYYLY